MCPSPKAPPTCTRRVSCRCSSRGRAGSQPRRAQAPAFVFCYENVLQMTRAGDLRRPSSARGAPRPIRPHLHKHHGWLARQRQEPPHLRNSHTGAACVCCCGKWRAWVRRRHPSALPTSPKPPHQTFGAAHDGVVGEAGPRAVTAEERRPRDLLARAGCAITRNVRARTLCSPTCLRLYSTNTSCASGSTLSSMHSTVYEDGTPGVQPLRVVMLAFGKARVCKDEEGKAAHSDVPCSCARLRYSMDLHLLRNG
jgi:hypothetical protein